jgi:hypothetical protein
MPNAVRRVLENPLDCLRVLGAIGRAAYRVGRESRDTNLCRQAGLADLVVRLREPGGSRRSSGASDADALLALALVEPLLPLLPPYGSGRCVKRSLILLDLWSRAGLEPSLHLGLREGNGVRQGHAWVTTRNERICTYHPPDIREAFRA